MKYALGAAVMASCALAAAGCSTVMEAERPSATNLSKFSAGDSRVDVISKIGPPAPAKTAAPTG